MSALKILSKSGLNEYASRQPTAKHPTVKANDSAMYLATQPSGGHFLGALSRLRDSQIDVIEYGGNQQHQSHNE